MRALGQLNNPANPSFPPLVVWATVLKSIRDSLETADTLEGFASEREIKDLRAAKTYIESVLPSTMLNG